MKNRVRQRDNLYLSILCMMEDHLTVCKADVAVLDVANRSGAASTVQQEIDDNPIPILAELTIRRRTTQEQF